MTTSEKETFELMYLATSKMLPTNRLVHEDMAKIATMLHQFDVVQRIESDLNRINNH
jgi:hypothetical protein